MQVVHGLWTTTKRDGPGLFIWLEDAALRMKNQLFEPISDFMPGDRGKSGGKQANQPEKHPFALETNEVFHAVRGLLRPHLGPQSSAPGQVSTLDLLLPTVDEAPLASPWLRQTSLPRKQPRDGESTLQPWRVAGVRLPPQIALRWLISLDLRLRHPSLVYSESIQFWRNASSLAFYSLIHGTYEPLLQKVDHQIKAKWVLNASILANQLEHLEKRLPPICQNEWSADGVRRTRDSIVRDFFNTSIDCLIRNVAGAELLNRLNQRRPQRKRKKQNPLDSLTTPMLKALYGKQNSFSAARDVQAAFVALVTNWLQQEHKAEPRQWTTCFTVIPPEIGNARIEDVSADLKVWRVAFSLQNLRDPNHHIYADEIWENQAPTDTGEGRTLVELFLRDLGRALQYFPELRPALDAPYPTYVDLNGEQIYRFLTEQSLHLQSADFGLVLPAWWKKDTKRLKTSIQIDGSDLERKGMMGFDSMINFSWKATVGGQALSETAFQKMVKHKMALLPINGQWVEIKPEDLWEAVAFFEERETSGQMSLREAMHLGMRNEQVKNAFEEVAFDYDGALAQLFESENDTPPQVSEPAGLRGKLRPYQLRGLSWLAFHDRLGFGACLADDMGLGKTIQLLSLLLHERETGAVPLNRQPTLLICPMSVVGNWRREAHRFTPALRAMVHHGADRFTKKAFVAVHKNYDLIITTYHLANRDFDIFGDIEWRRVALDEAQNIKNPAAQQSKAILSLKTRKRIALTGTPVENKLSELWSIMEFLNPGYLGSLKSFQTRFAAPIERQQDKEKAKLLRQLTQPFILRRLKTDQNVIRDLPEKIEMKVYCDLTDEQAAIYQAYVQAQIKEIEGAQGIQRNQLVLTTLVKLKQICNHPVQFLQDGSTVDERSGKLMRLTEMLEEALEEGDSSLIFTQFMQMGTILEKYLGEKFGQEVLFMHGGVSQQRRQEMVDRFQSKSGPKIFILTVKTGGAGLNLTAATHVFHYDRWWNPAVENQATDRAFRIGQERNVQVHKLIAIGTLEDRIDMMIEKKKELADNIIGADENWIAQLSTDALREVLTLSVNQE